MEETPNKTRHHLKVATLSLPTRETQVLTLVFPGATTLLTLAEVNLNPGIRAEFTAGLTRELEKCRDKIKETSSTPDVQLELVVSELNSFLQQHQGILGNPLAPRCRLCVCAIQNTELAISSMGYLSAILIDSTQATNILETPRRSNNPRLVFENITSGSLINDETLILALPTLFDYFSLDKLKTIAANRAPGLALRDIEKFTSSLPHHPPLGIIALSLEEIEDLSTDASVDHLLKTKADTSLLLRPKLLPTLREKLRSTINTSFPYKRKVEVKEGVDNKLETIKKDTLPPPPSLPTKPYVPQITLGQRINNVWQRSANTLTKLSWLRKPDTIKSTLSYWLESKIRLFIRLPFGKKILLTLALLILVIFCQSIVTLGRQHLSAEDSDNYNQLITQVTEKLSTAEAALIYHDDEKTKQLLGEAASIIKLLPTNTNSRQRQYSALLEHQQVLSRRLERRADIKAVDLVRWVKLPLLSKNELWNGIWLSKDSVQSVSTTGSVINIGSDKKISTIAKLPTDFQPINKVYPLNNQTVLLKNNQGSQLVLDTKKGSSTKVENNLSFIDINTYEDKLYYLASKPKAIFRTSWDGKTFTTPVRWLKTNQGELTSATSLTVDGSVFVSEGNTINKYVLGTKRDFKFQPLVPALDKISQIRTTSTQDNLYLFSQVDKRVVVYDKQGKLIVQLFFTGLDNINDLATDSANRVLYLLSNNEIYKVQLVDYTQ